MTKYDIMFEALQEKVNSGELTVEEAEVLNTVAFEKYGEDETEYEEVTESSEDEGVTYEEYLEAMEYELFGEATRLSKELDKKHMIKDYEKEREEKIYHGDIMSAIHGPGGARQREKFYIQKDKESEEKIAKLNDELDELENTNSLNQGRRIGVRLSGRIPRDRMEKDGYFKKASDTKKAQVEKYNLSQPSKPREAGKYLELQNQKRK